MTASGLRSGRPQFSMAIDLNRHFESVEIENSPPKRRHSFLLHRANAKLHIAKLNDGYCLKADISQ
jgi:hypothetical protein